MLALLLVKLLVAIADTQCSAALEQALTHAYKKATSNATYPSDPALWRNTGKGFNDLGHYASCIRDSRLTYFMLEVKLFGLPTFTGLCIPKQCTLSDVQSYITTPSIKIHEIHSEKLPALGYVLICFIFLFIIFGIASSIFNLPSKKSKFFALINCFSFKNNYKSLMNIRKTQPGDNLSILNGVRVIAMMQVIEAHVLSFKTHNAVLNVEEIPNFVSRWYMPYMYNALFSVDMFFWLGGFLLGYGMLLEVEKKRGKFGLIGWVFVFVHRLIRVIPVYGFMLIFYMIIFPSVSEGPMWDNVKIITKDCSDYWWTVLLFLNNFVPGGYGNQCLGVGWYLACDIQFFVLGILLTILYYFSAKWLIWALKGIIIAVCFVVSFLIAQEYGYTAFLLNPKNAQGGNRDYYHMHYTKPYTRIFPYIVGLFCGFVYLRYHKKYVTNENDSHQEPISTLLIRYFKDPVYGTVFFAIGVCIFIINTFDIKDFYDDVMNSDVWSPAANSFFLPFRVILFCFQACFLMMPVLFGNLKVVKTILGADIFQPLAKLTFCCFLVQFGLVFLVYSVQDAQILMNGRFFFRDLVVCEVLSFILSVPLYFLIEVPFKNFFELIFKK